MAGQPFLTDIQTIRNRARQHIKEGAVTENYGADKVLVIRPPRSCARCGKRRRPPLPFDS